MKITENFVKEILQECFPTDYQMIYDNSLIKGRLTHD